jgi:hypothetical protein
MNYVDRCDFPHVIATLATLVLRVNPRHAAQYASGIYYYHAIFHFAPFFCMVKKNSDKPYLYHLGRTQLMKVTGTTQVITRSRWKTSFAALWPPVTIQLTPAAFWSPFYNNNKNPVDTIRIEIKLL